MQSLPAAKPKPRHKARQTVKAPERVSATFKIPVPTHRRLKQIAADEQTNLQEILTEAVDAWLNSRDEVPFNPEGE